MYEKPSNLSRNQRRIVKNTPDILLITLIIFITAFGVVMVYSSSHYHAVNMGRGAFYFAGRQCVFAIAGIIGMLFIAYKFDYRILSNMKIAGLIYAIALALGIALFFVGTETNGSTRWLDFGLFTIQPSEIVKIAVIIMLSAYITKYRSKLDSGRYILYGLIIIGVPTVIILKENLSSAIVIACVGLVILFLTTPNIRYYLMLPIAAIGGMSFALYLANAYPQGEGPGWIAWILPGYRIDRFRVWLDPWIDPLGGGYQPIQSLYAIGSGGLFGQGLGMGIQKRGFIPEPHNDIIFAVIAEELGLIGAIILLIGYSIVVMRGLTIATKANDLFGALVATAISCMVGVQVIINVAVNTNAIPTTGMQLPLISYGGTALLILLLSLGILINISRFSAIDKPRG